MSKNIYTRKLLPFFSTLFLFLGLENCNSEKEKEPIASEINYTVTPAPQWSELFKRDSGWFGADGIFTIPYSGHDGLQNDSILFLFSDTVIGELNNGKLDSGFVMVNNSVALYQKGRAPSTTEFFVNENELGEKSAVFIPDGDTDQYYWVGDGFVNTKNKKLYIFSYQVRSLDNDSPFPFEEVGNDLLIVENKNEFPLKVVSKLPIPFSDGGEIGQRISFGAGVYTEEDRIYIYGVRGDAKELVMARTTMDELEDFSSWEFRTTNGWSEDLTELQVLAEGVSNELSVSKLDNDQYILVYQEGGIYPKIYFRLADSPYGPFGQKSEIWDTSDDITHPNLYTYNAKAHPALSNRGELVVSYNVNSFNFFEDLQRAPQLYRPRFVKIKFHTAE